MVILPEEHGYMEEERGYIAGRARLYFCNENIGLPKLLCWSHALRSDQYLSCSASRTYFDQLDQLENRTFNQAKATCV